VSAIAAALIGSLFGVQTTAQQTQSVVLFQETFTKDATGTLDLSRVFTAAAGPVAVSLTNGSAGNFDIIRNGRVLVNGQLLFSPSDFKIAGTISRTVTALNGGNTLDISLSGPAAGQLTIQVTQEQTIQTLQFPAGTIFVSAAQSSAVDDATCGLTKTSPCKTIGRGIGRAGAIGGSQVVVGAGVYAENVVLRSGVSVLGGYDPEFTRRDLTYFHPILRGTTASPFTVPATVQAVSIVNPTVFEGFILLAPASVIPGANSIGIYIQNSTAALIVRNNLILGGVAASGTAGVVGTDGTPGPSGSPGAAVVSLGSSVIGGPNVGGSGGFGTSGVTDISGGRGGSASNPLFDHQEEGGFNGHGNGGLGGLGGYDGMTAVVNGACVVLSPTVGSKDGVNGRSGLDGSNGAAVVGGNGGSIASGAWVGASGQSGSNGSPGGGGGGGGAGGGVVGLSSCDGSLGGSKKIGPSGGGGGAGGAAGIGGGSGGGGGSSFGIFVLASGASYPRIGANDIQLGIGGNGGNGGTGGIGGSGGTGGAGGAADSFTGIAGSGGSGGRGGHGSGGGGGAGGNAIGIFANYSAPEYVTDNSIVADTGRAGSGGAGGPSFGNPGQPGASGVVTTARLTP